MLTNRKLEVVRQRLSKEVDRLGMDVVIHRPEYVSDGSNGYVSTGNDIEFTVRGILKSLPTTAVKSFTATDGGKTYDITETLSVVYNAEVKFQMYDWFMYNGCKYTILRISNVGEQNVYWLLGLSMEPQEVERYGE